MLESTSKFKVVEIIFDDGEFAIAKGFWDGGSRLSVACRWYAEGIGYPQTFGKAQWMMLPSPIVDIEDALNPERSKVTLVFDPTQRQSAKVDISDTLQNQLAG